MGFYHGPAEPPSEKEPGGCGDVLLLTRVVFGVILGPLAILLGTLVGVVVVIYLFTLFWGFGLIGLAVLIAAIAFYAHWERNHFRGPA